MLKYYRKSIWIILQVATVWICLLEFERVSMVPVKKKTIFPEQTLPNPIRLRDGHTPREKLFIIKMINLLERQSGRRQGVTAGIPWLSEYVFEGDIILQSSQALDLVNRNNGRKKRKMDAEVTSSDAKKKWPLPINYIFDGQHSKEQQEEIQAGVQHWQDNTCITFTNYTSANVNKSIKFIKDFGCYSYVGNSPGETEQIISIGENCTRKGIVAHEIGHALGFWHEHARADRDEYLSIIMDNIKIGQHHNFDKMSWEVINNLAIPYDLGSVMHYSGQQFGKGNEQTIRTNNRLLQHTIGQREELSFFDVKLANKAYCDKVCDPTTLSGTCLHDGYQDPTNCSRCRCPAGLAGDLCDMVAPSSPDTCGGSLQLNASSKLTIESPDYPERYQKGMSCNWLIKSPKGTVLHIQFKEPFMQSEYCNSESPYLPCEDYVEVRFTDSLGTTGGRFCCDDPVQKPVLQVPIITHSNHALILFRTFAPGKVGFRADVTIDSCGGCHNTVTEQQAACLKKTTTECVQTWYKVVKLNSCVFSFWGCHTAYQTQAVQRNTYCYSEVPYCCHGYNLSQDSKFCTRDPAAQTLGNTDDQTSDDSGSVPDTTSPEQDQEVPTGWSSWSVWSECSVTCGGCGQQTRTRSCSEGGVCDGDPSETQTCGHKPCNYGNVQQTCARTRTKSQSCPFFLFGASTCYVKVTEYYSQTLNCCCGYDVRGGVCQLSTE